MRSSLFSFVKFCRKCKATSFHPEDVTIPQGAHTKEKRILQPSDIVALFSCETTILNNKRVFDDLIYAYRFHVLTGLRPGELLGLQWGDVAGDVVHVQRSVNIRGEITTGKNENANRIFALTRTAFKLLIEQRKICCSEYIFGGYKESNYRKRWIKFCQANELQVTTPYELRHTFVSAAKNLPEGQLKQLVGHSRNMDTLGVYGHMVQGDMQKTAESLEVIFGDILSSQKQ